jgi:hypothetical protein
MKYSFEIQLGKHYSALKAIHDATQIARQSGYTPFCLKGIRSTNKFTRYFSTIVQSIRILLTIKPDDICFIQWPLYTASDKLLYPMIKHKCKHLRILVHDLDSYRQKSDGAIEKKYLELAEEIIVHTTAMQIYLHKKGIKKENTKILTTFDYLIYTKFLPRRHLSNEIVFAGNLSKSIFLMKFTHFSIDMTLLCYGKDKQPIKPPLIYKGYFEPDNPSIIQGSWGLVWEGESTETCIGMLGEYLRINAPHKASLYIVARLPIIIWKEAALAPYIKEKGLGFCISSLSEIPNYLAKITEEDYLLYLSNIDKERDNLINGRHLKNLLVD